MARTRSGRTMKFRSRELKAGFAVFGEYRNHATQGIVVERRERTTQHLDVSGRNQVKLGELPMSVRHRARNAIRIQARAAHAELRAGTKAEHRKLQILGIVLSVLRRRTGHGVECFRQIDLELSQRDLTLVDTINRNRQVHARLQHACGRDHDAGEIGRWICRHWCGIRRVRKYARIAHHQDGGQERVVKRYVSPGRHDRQSCCPRAAECGA